MSKGWGDISVIWLWWLKFYVQNSCKGRRTESTKIVLMWLHACYGAHGCACTWVCVHMGARAHMYTHTHAHAPHLHIYIIMNKINFNETGTHRVTLNVIKPTVVLPLPLEECNELFILKILPFKPDLIYSWQIERTSFFMTGRNQDWVFIISALQCILKFSVTYPCQLKWIERFSDE